MRADDNASNCKGYRYFKIYQSELSPATTQTLDTALAPPRVKTPVCGLPVEWRGQALAQAASSSVQQQQPGRVESSSSQLQPSHELLALGLVLALPTPSVDTGYQCVVLQSIVQILCVVLLDTMFIIVLILRAQQSKYYIVCEEQCRYSRFRFDSGR